MQVPVAEKISGPVFKAGPVVLAAALIALDVGFFQSRCAASPAVNWSAFALGCAIQAAAVALLSAPRWLSFAPTRLDLRWLAPLALMLGFVSLPIMQDSIRFSDSIGQTKGFVSQGRQCSAR